MRKVSEQAVKALLSGQNFRRDNTRVEDGKMILHDSTIVKKDGANYLLCLCGWNTPTTRERLNAVCSALGHGRPFHQHKGLPMYNGSEIGSHEVITIQAK